MSERDYTFRWGDICWHNDPIPCDGDSHVQHGRRPAVVVSANRYNETSTTVMIVPMTTNTNKRVYPNQIEIALNGQRSRVRCDQIKVVDKHELEPPHARLNLAAMGAVESALLDALGINLDNAGTAVLSAVSTTEED